MRIKIFNEETKKEALHLLQPVTPTDETHPADWYHQENGGKILAVQKSFISIFKRRYMDCKNKSEIKELIEVAFTPQWLPYINSNATTEAELLQDNIDFWSTGFGYTIAKEWNTMFDNFINFLNELQ